MAQIILGTLTATYDALGTGNTFVADKESIVNATNGILYGSEPGINTQNFNTYQINAKLQANDNAVLVYGSNNTINLSQDGFANGGNFGVAMLGAELDVLNNGTITGGNAGLAIYAAGRVTIQNNAYISSVNSASLFLNLSPAGNVEIKNAAKGYITQGILVDAADATSNIKVVNEGSIKKIADGAGTETANAIVMGAGIDTIINSGAIVGNVLLGDGNDLFDNRLGTAGDIIWGGKGNDIYSLSSFNKIREDASEGNDTIRATLSFNLSDALYANQEIENLELLGTAALNATGNALNNTLVGNIGANILDGRSGADGMFGGGGNDTYYVDIAFDTVTEKANEGIDTVRSEVDFTLGANVENLVLAGNAMIGTGNTLNNSFKGDGDKEQFYGLEGNDTFDGGAGNDDLFGGKGNDTYILRAFDATIHENAGEGIDRVMTDKSYVLGATLENLTLTGTAAVKGTGNAVNNALVGNGAANILVGLGGNDVLNGAGGADQMFGGVGNDIYVVNVATDRVYEGASGGMDTVYSVAATFTLSSYIERLTLQGSANIGGTGNAQANTITGNGGRNALNGGGGNDLIKGVGGNDLIKGGSGNDRAYGGVGADRVYGDGGSDRLYGDSGNDTAWGGLGNDSIYGGAGNDRLYGDSGNDKLYGEGGNDIMTGGSGGDTFVFKNNFGRDVITDFRDGDHIDLRAVSAISSFKDLTSHTHMRDSGSDTIIMVGSSTITLKGVDMNDLDKGDFYI